MSPSIAFRLLCATLPLAALSACGSSSSQPQFPPVCPQTGILRDAADITRFRAAGTDLTDMVVDGRITGLSGSCALDDPTHLRTKLNVALDLSRGPANSGNTATIGYFVSVSKGKTILAKQEYRLAAKFTDNADQLKLLGEEVDLVLPVNDTTSGAAYNILVGFQLTPGELAFNRRRGPR